MIDAPAAPPQLIRTATGATFRRLILEGAGPIVVEFMAYGCAHCRALEPVLKQVTRMLGSAEQVFRVNVAVDEELANSYEIGATPTLLMFLDAKEVGRLEGPRPVVASLLSAVVTPFSS
ncbi:MAG: thioredoxin family protein [Candidatus Velthaea sp.]|jgi:thioredoxin 1